MSPVFPRGTSQSEHEDVSLAVLTHRIDQAERSIEIARTEAAKEVEAVRDLLARQSSFQRWVIVILIGIGTSIAGVAWSAHSQMGDRLIDLTRLTEQQLGRLEERIAAIQQYGIPTQRAASGQ